ncbi:MAG: molybdopterin-dependent oxidoreductase [Chloroflexi bacterium]|nr:molybdopterin-dependent oxidoreductase [Chloroflexota bacterium]
METSQVIKTACQICPINCGLTVYLKGGKVVKIEGQPENPVTKGGVCIKAARAMDWMYHPDRLKQPRKRHNGEWKDISWDEALETIVTRLQEVKEAYGPQALGVYVGCPALDQAWVAKFIQRFTDLFGTPNIFRSDTCFYSRQTGNRLTYGDHYSPDPENAKCVMVVGFDPHASAPNWQWAIDRSLKKGARLIVVDPRRTAVAKKANVHVQPRPGTDCALLLAMLNVIISEQLYDQEFVSKWTVGFEQLGEHLRQYSPEEVEKITWVPAAAIREMARTFATSKPACIIYSISTLDMTSSGVENSQAIAMLQAITGNLQVEGGWVSMPVVPSNPIRLPDKIPGKAPGQDEFPVFYEMVGATFTTAQGPLLTRTIESGKIKALIVAAANPILTSPDARRVQEALSKLDFLVVHDLFMTETAKLAHIVLPATTFLERTDIVHVYPWLSAYPYVMARKKTVEIEGCWPDTRLWLELAKRMGYGQYFPWRNWEEVLDYIYQPSELTVEYLTRDKPEGVFYDTVKYRQYEREGFPTPSGKVELYSKTLERLGCDPLPTYKEPSESPISTPELAADYPLILIAGSRLLQYHHSQHRNVARLRKGASEPMVELHADTAAQYGIADGDTVVISTKRGSIELKAQTTRDIVPGVVNMAHGWEEANVNLLTDEAPASPMAPTPLLKGLLCKMSKKAI